MNFRPMRDLMLILPDAAATKVGSIIIAETAAERPMTGTVIAVGPGKRERGELVPVTVAVGSRVVYTKMVGTEINLEGTKYLLINPDEIVGVLA